MVPNGLSKFWPWVMAGGMSGSCFGDRNTLHEQPLCSSQDHGFISIFCCNLPGTACQAVSQHSIIIELILYIALKTTTFAGPLFALGRVKGQHYLIQIMLSRAFRHSKRCKHLMGVQKWEQILSGFSVGDGGLLGHPWSFIKIQVMLKNNCS